MSSRTVCAGCKQTPPVMESLVCYYCQDKYDLQCSNITIDLFKSMTPEHKKIWQCQACRCKALKTGNIDTPLRLQDHKKTNPPNSPQDNTGNNNVTIRKKTTIFSNDTSITDESSLLGDTMMHHEDSDINVNMNMDISPTISLENLSEIIIQRLKENNKCIISELQNTIQVEINKAITKLKQDIEGKTDFLYKQNDKKTQEIEEINKKIEKLSDENEALKNEINTMKFLPPTKQVKETDNNCKKIVIYGFSEFYNESETELHNRLIEMFYEILQVDLNGYIEETKRIGRLTTKSRPLIVELLSKKMTRYIVENSHYFQGTNIHVSEFLNENARKERKLLREEMLRARRNGQYAVIRNNKLFIDGKRILTNEKMSRETETTYRKSNIISNEQVNNEEKTLNTKYNKPNNNEFIKNHNFRNHRTTF